MIDTLKVIKITSRDIHRAFEAAENESFLQKFANIIASGYEAAKIDPNSRLPVEEELDLDFLNISRYYK